MTFRDMQICDKLLKEIDVIRELMNGYTVESFAADERTFRAVCMTLINIGELVKNLSQDFRQGHSDIPWKAIAGLRDIAAHKYQTLQRQDIFLTCTEDIDELKEKLKQLL